MSVARFESFLGSLLYLHGVVYVWLNSKATFFLSIVVNMCFGVLEGSRSIQAESMVQQGFDSLRVFNRI